jgi:sulfur-oxidizing protein SoxB
VRAPYEAKLAEKLAVTEGTLYRRGNFNGSGDQLLIERLMDVQGARSPSRPASAGALRCWRAGHHARVADGHDRHHVLVRHRQHHERRDAQDRAGGRRDNLFNPTRTTSRAATWCAWAGCSTRSIPRRRWAGASRTCADGKPIEASRNYKVAGWAPVAEEAAKAGNKPVWELVEQWLKARGGKVAPRQVNVPRLSGGCPTRATPGLRPARATRRLRPARAGPSGDPRIPA